MNESWKIQISPKLADGTLINLRAENAAEAEGILKWATENAPLIQQTVAAFVGTNGVAAVLPTQSVQVQQAPAQGGWAGQQGPAPDYAPPVAPAAPQGAPTGQQHCVHGPMQLRGSKPGAPRQWQAWMCPTPKGTPGQCSPLDAKTLKPWG